MRKELRAGSLASIAGLVVACMVGNAGPATAAGTSPETQRQRLFSAAAEEFSVPEEILLAVSYNESRWTPHGNEPSIDNGFGLMNLRAKAVALPRDGRGDPSRPVPGSDVVASRYTLDDAARLLAVPPAQARTDERTNVRGAAAVLAEYGRQLNRGRTPARTADW